MNSNQYPCAICGRNTSTGIRIDSERQLVVCSTTCLRDVRIGEYFPHANLATVYLTRQEFGHQGWIVLHSLAYSYPVEPMEIEKLRMRSFLTAFAQQYPCARCRSHLLPMIKEYPPKLESRRAFVYWVWQRHNQVSRRLGKDEYPFRFDTEQSTSIGYDSTENLFKRGYEGNLTERIVSRERLGTAFWMLLHSAAASYQYEQQVTDEHKYYTQQLYETLQYVYPYAEERDELRKLVKETHFPRILRDRRLYMAWLCSFHNRINAKLGKPVYSARRIREALDAYQCKH